MDESGRRNREDNTRIDRAALETFLVARGLNPEGLSVTHPHLFADVPVWVDESSVRQIICLIETIERVIALPCYREAVLSRDSGGVSADPGYPGVFMGYDFHVGEGGAPQLIEINTNAGGAFLSALLLASQSGAQGEEIWRRFCAWVVEMFRGVWRSAGRKEELLRIALVDETPQTQYLAPEFELCRQVLTDAGWQVVVSAPEELFWDGGSLTHAQLGVVDLLYNRLTDFSLSEPGHAAILKAWQRGRAVVTPHPYAHRLYADKRNLALLTDAEWLVRAGVSEDAARVLLAGIPRVERVIGEDREARFWRERRHLFFKPADGFGGRAAYRGEKLSRRVFAEILAGEYVAQSFTPPPMRYFWADTGEEKALKWDLRCYAFEGRPGLYAARLYQGQTTNFRTPGGGFASALP